jgi:hypothetical protein
MIRVTSPPTGPGKVLPLSMPDLLFKEMSDYPSVVFHSAHQELLSKSEAGQLSLISALGCLAVRPHDSDSDKRERNLSAIDDK